MVDPDTCSELEKNEILFEMAAEPPYSCILDGVQFVQINNAVVTQDKSRTSLRESADSVKSADPLKPSLISIRFHYTRRMAGIIREEEEKARIIFEK